MKAIVVTDEAAGTAGMTLAERPEPQAAINDVVVAVRASGFVPTELTWPSTWTDRAGRNRTPSIPGHELAGVVTALGSGTTGLSLGQRVLGLADWYRDGTLAEQVAIEARNLTPLPGDVDFTVGASLPISGLTAWQGLFVHGRLQAGQSVLAHGAAGAVGAIVTQLARELGAHVIGTGRAADRQRALDFGAMDFVDLDNDTLEDVGPVDLVFDVIGGPIATRSARLVRAGERWCPWSGRSRRVPTAALRSTSLSSPIAPSWLRSSRGRGTDACGPTSATSLPSTTRSRRSTRPSDARGRRSSASAHKAPALRQVKGPGAARGRSRRLRGARTARRRTWPCPRSCRPAGPGRRAPGSRGRPSRRSGRRRPCRRRGSSGRPAGWRRRSRTPPP